MNSIMQCCEVNKLECSLRNRKSVIAFLNFGAANIELTLGSELRLNTGRVIVRDVGLCVAFLLCHHL